MSRFNVLGPYSRHKMKRTSPFTSLLLEISLGLLEEDVSNLKLALQVDKFVKKIHLKKLKNGGEVLSHMHEENIITATDTEFLENVLMQIGRQDLVKKIEKYEGVSKSFEPNMERARNLDLFCFIFQRSPLPTPHTCPI